MADTTIEWCDKVWNPTRGCSRVSPGCGGAGGELRAGGCYAERQAARFCGPGQPYEGLVRVGKQGPRWTGVMRLVHSKLDEPLRWKKPCRIFVNSMSDIFHEGLTNEDIAAVFGVMAACPQHTFQILTKRATRMREWFDWVQWTMDESARLSPCPSMEAAGMLRAADRFGVRIRSPICPPWPLSNVWLGVSVEDQQRADERIPELLKVPAAVRFLSVEPMLGPVVLRSPYVGDEPEEHATMPLASHAEWDDWKYWAARDRGLSWVIVGGESGPGSRPFDLAWARRIVAQCRAAGVKIFVKQLGSNPMDSDGPVFDGARITEVTTADYKGGDPSEWPEDLRVREFPEVRE